MSGRSPTRPLKCSSDAEDIINAVLTMDEERCAFRSQIAALEAERDRLRGLLVDAPYAYAATTGKHNLRDWLCEVRAALGGDDE